MSAPLPISVVIPALNAETSIAAAIGSVRDHVAEIVVADAGSGDATARTAGSAGARVVEAARGRGTQLAAGAATATGDWLLFLHADTRLAEGWDRAAAEFIASASTGDRAGFFRLRLDHAALPARRIERLANWRARALGLPYGDQGLLIRGRFYEGLGGYRPLPLMEDVDLVRRIGRRRLQVLDADAITSASRYEAGGWWARPARNLCCLALYFLGVPPRVIAGLYR